MSTQVESVQKIEARFRVGEWFVAPSLNRVMRDGDEVQLAFKAMDLLICLAERAGELVEKRELVDTVWQTEFVADNTLTKRIAELREALGDDAREPRYIETIPKRGYRLIAEVIFFDDAVAADTGSLERKGPEEVSPYPGLEPFTEADSENFFGRESEITALWRRITSRRLLAVIGPSGAGKSSLLRAGVVARAPPGWRAVVCQPGEEPFLALARSLAPDLSGDAEEMGQLLAFHDPDAALAVSSRWRGRWDEALLVVDQFEELFTLSPEPVQERFVDLLRRLVDAAGIHVVLVLRDDFLLECHRHPQLAPIFAELTPVGPPPGPELRRAITQPAARRLFAFENQLLVDEMVAEVEAERGALPLLAFAVSRLWALRDRDRRMLTREAYEKIGGVGGALAQHAEATLEAIGDEQLPVVRELFRNLVTAQGTRAVRDVDDLLSIFDAPLRDKARSVLDALVNARLLTSFDEATANEETTAPDHRVEIVHESLLRAWPRLVRWQTQDADAAQLRDQLRQAAQLWQARGKPDDLLWTGASYREFRVWQECYPGGLTSIEEEFANAMVGHAGRRRRRRRFAAVSILLVALAVAVVTTTLWRRSEDTARRLEAQRLYEIGRRTIDRAPAEALAWSIASLEIVDDPATRRLALQALWNSPMPAAVDAFETGEYTVSAMFSPDGNWLASGTTDGKVFLWPPGGGAPKSWQAHQGPTGVLFSTEPRALLTLGLGDPKAVFWSVPGGARLNEAESLADFMVTDMNPGDAQSVLRMIRFVEDPGVESGWTIDHRPADLRRRLQDGHRPRAALGPEGRNLIFARGPELFLADVERPDESPRAIGRCGADVKQIAFHPDGSHYATVDTDGMVVVWRLSEETAEQVRSWQGLADEECGHLSFDPTGRFIAASYDMGGALIFGLDDPPGSDPLGVQPAGSRLVQSRFDPSGRCLATASMGRLAVWPVQRSRRPYTLRGHSGQVDKLEFGPGGAFLVSTGTDGTVRQWPLTWAQGAEPRIVHDWGGPIEVLASSLALSEDGRVIVATGNESFVRVIPLDGRPAHDLARSDQRVTRAAVSSNGRLVAVLGLYDNRYVIRIWDLASGTIESIDLPEDPGWPPLSYPLEFTQDGRLLFSFASRLREWDPATKEITEFFKGVWTFALNGDGCKLIGRPGLGFSGEAVATVYDLEDASSTRLTSHGSKVMSLALDPTGTIAVTGDIYGNLRVGPASGDSPHILILEGEGVYTVAVSPDGRWIASGHSDGSIRLWPMPDLTKPPIHELPYREFLAKLKSLTNLRVVPNPEIPGSQVVRAAAPFPGWETVPEW